MLPSLLPPPFLWSMDFTGMLKYWKAGSLEGILKFSFYHCKLFFHMANTIFKDVTCTYHNSWYLGYKDRRGQSANVQSHVLSFNPIRINTKYPNFCCAFIWEACFIWFLFTGTVKKFLHPNYVEVLLSLTTIKCKWLESWKWTTTHLVLFGEIINSYVICQLRQASCLLEAGGRIRSTS